MWLVEAIEAVRNCALDESLRVLNIYITATFIKGLADILLGYKPIPVYIKIPENTSNKIISYTNEFFEVKHHA